MFGLNQCWFEYRTHNSESIQVPTYFLVGISTYKLMHYRLESRFDFIIQSLCEGRELTENVGTTLSNPQHNTYTTVL